MTKREVYKNILSDIIKEHMVLFDPQVALALIHPLSNIKVTADGTVIGIKGDPDEVFSEIKEAYASFGGELSEDTMNAIINSYTEYNSKLS